MKTSRYIFKMFHFVLFIYIAMNDEINLTIISLWRDYILNKECTSKNMTSNKDKHESIAKNVNELYGTKKNSDNIRYAIKNWKTKYSKVCIIKYH